MTREEFVKQRCEIDKITEEEFEETYRVVECNCGKPYCKGYRCLDLDGLLKENQELKEQVEECKEKINWYENFEVNKTIDQLRLKHNIQQKDFIKYLEDEIENKGKKSTSLKAFERNVMPLKHALQKYKEIVGVSDENNTSL